MKRLRRYARVFGYARILCIFLVFAFVGLRVWDPPPLEEVRVRTFDAYQLLEPRKVTSRPVVIIDIDERSLAKYGQWPWPRTLVADLVQRLTNLDAAVIAFDIIFAEPDRMSPSLAADAFTTLDDDTRA